MTTSQDPGAEHAGKGGKKTSTGRTVLEYVVLAVVAIAVALLIQAFLVKPYRIPSESMENTLLIGDRVLVDRISWRFSDPERQQRAERRKALQQRALEARNAPGGQLAVGHLRRHFRLEVVPVARVGKDLLAQRIRKLDQRIPPLWGQRLCRLLPRGRLDLAHCNQSP